MPITMANFVNLKNGQFDATSRRELTDLMDRFVQSNRRNLVIHFHGGLVAEDKAMAMAERLLPEYEQTDVAYPLFFVWESSLLEAIRNNAGEIANEKFFIKLLQKVLQFAGGKVLQGVAERGISVTPLDDRMVDDEVARAQSGGPSFDGLTEDQLAATSDLTELEARQLRDFVESDPAFMAEVQAISNSIEPADQLARSRGAEVAGSRRTLMSPDVLADIQRERELGVEGTRGIFGGVRLIKGVITIVARVVGRFARKRDHGFHATAVEEIFREFYVSAVGREVWGLMKKDTSDAFGENTLLFGGSALLEELARVDPQNQTRITLVGHSAGAEYICNLLKHVDRFLPATYQFDIVLLAPACRTEFFAEVLRHHAGHIRHFRMFTMFDDVEKKDRLIPVVYPHSLLYFIAGVLEDEADKPVLGLERYYVSSAKHYQKPDTGIPAVKAFLSTPGRTVMSVSSGAAGFQSNSLSHGGFDDTAAAASRSTIDSVMHILKHGF